MVKLNRESVNKLITVKETSNLLNIHCNTVRRWSDRGILFAVRIGPRGDRRFWREDIDLLLKNGTSDTSLVTE